MIRYWLHFNQSIPESGSWPLIFQFIFHLFFCSAPWSGITFFFTWPPSFWWIRYRTNLRGMARWSHRIDSPSWLRSWLPRNYLFFQKTWDKAIRRIVWTGKLVIGCVVFRNPVAASRRADWTQASSPNQDIMDLSVGNHRYGDHRHRPKTRGQIEYHNDTVQILHLDC